MAREPKPIRWKTLLALLALALTLGSLYRFTDLGKKPMHTDEAILALKTQEYWETGTFEYDPKDYLYFRVDRRRKMPVTILLKALGYTPEQILKEFFTFDTFHVGSEGIEFELVPERMRGAYNDPWSWSGPATLVVSLYGPDRRHENLWTCRVDLGSCQALPEDAQVYSLGW